MLNFYCILCTVYNLWIIVRLLLYIVYCYQIMDFFFYCLLFIVNFLKLTVYYLLFNVYCYPFTVYFLVFN